MTAGFVRTFNRYEVKYLVHRERASEFIGSLSGFVAADTHSDGDRGYLVQSVYWDSPGLACFWEKVEGLKDRRKLRTRRYGDSPKVFLEIKQRTDRTVQKRRTRTGADLFRTRDSLRQLDMETRRDPVVSEALCLVHGYDLHPTIGITYRRRAWAGRYDPGARITVDTELRYQARDLDIRASRSGGPYFLDPRLAIVEIKYNDRIPRWLSGLTASANLRFVRFSKYCSAVDVEHFDNDVT